MSWKGELKAGQAQERGSECRRAEGMDSRLGVEEEVEGLATTQGPGICAAGAWRRVHRAMGRAGPRADDDAAPAQGPGSEVPWGFSWPRIRSTALCRIGGPG